MIVVRQSVALTPTHIGVAYVSRRREKHLPAARFVVFRGR